MRFKRAAARPKSGRIKNENPKGIRLFERAEHLGSGKLGTDFKIREILIPIYQHYIFYNKANMRGLWG